jgi:hypothetical protein
LPSREEALEWLKGDKDGILDNQSAHSSWSSDPKIAKDFSSFGGKGAQPVVIRGMNKTGASVRSLAYYANQDEVVVLKDARHKVKSITEKDGVIYADVEEVDTPIEKPAKQEEVKAQQQPPVRKVGKLTPSVASIEEMLKTTEEWLDKSEKYLTIAKKVLKASPPGEIIKYGNNQEIERKVLEKKIGLVGDSRTVTFGLGVTAESIELGETEPGVQDTFFLKDESGKTQGFFLTGNDKSKESMYIEFLGTNPSNIITNTKGVGKQIIYHAIQESMKRGFRGKIKLEALSSAEPFYESVGFTTKIGVDGYTEDFDLSEESAKAFVKEYEKKLKQDKI